LENNVSDQAHRQQEKKKCTLTGKERNDQMEKYAIL
jgi:hypothetical protein